MSSKHVLAENIRSMIGREGLSVRGFALKHKLQQKMVDRIAKQEHAVSLDTLDDLAKAVGLFSWQLLIPGLDPSNPPHVAITESEVLLYKRLSELMKATK